MSRLDVTSTHFRITRDCLPQGLWWEPDGACWTADVCEPDPLTGQDWRWVPKNFRAFGKGEPTAPMAPYPKTSFGDIVRVRE